MANSGVIGKRAKDGQGRVSLGDKFVQTVFPIPSITGFTVDGLDDTALDTAGGQTVVITGTNFAAGATVIVGGNTIGSVTVVNTTTITFTSEARSSGTYTVFVVNADGGTAILTPGLIYSGLPTFTTGAGSLGTYYETTAISETIEATEGADVITYAITAGSLPAGATLASNGVITGTAPVESASTTYTFTVEAIDEELQSSTRQFSLTINADVVTWVSPSEGSVSLDGDTAMSAITLSATSGAGYNVSYAADVLPTGVALANGVVSGTPTVEETVSTTFTATAATTGRSATRTVTFVVSLGDAYFKDTVLLLNGDVNTFITDASSNSLTLTPSGDVRPSAFSPYNTSWSNYFDGTGDYLTAPANAAYNFGSDNFTVEFWFKRIAPKGQSFHDNIVGNRPTSFSSGQWHIYVGAAAGGAFSFQTRTPAGDINITGGVCVENSWMHIAAVRNGTDLRLYVNGVSVASTTTTATIGSSSNAFGIGAFNDGAYPCIGYISNLRIVKGTAVYTEAFTPPTAPLTAISGTSLLTCQSNRFVDNSTNNFAITRNGDAKVTAFGPFVDSDATTGSGYFDGTSDNLSLADNAATLSAFNGTVAMTFEAWVFPTNPSWVLATAMTTSANQFWWELYHSATDGFSMTFGLWGSSSAQAKTGSSQLIPINQWTHVVWQRRSDNTVEIFFNGVSQTVTNGFYGSYVGAQLNGPGVAKLGGGGYYTDEPIYISNFRFTKDRVYTSNFTPPTAPLTAISGTSLLTLQNRISYNNSQPIDESGVKNIVTRAGNTSVGTFSPFVPTGWSAYFDGTGDYLNTPSAGQFAPAGAFTIECFFYLTSYNTSQAILSNYDVNEASSWLLQITNIGILRAYTNGGVIRIASGDNAVSLGQWYHVALTRNASNVISLFLNGALIGTYTQSGTFGSTTKAIYIGAQNTSSGFAPGYISNVRMIDGTAVYTENFTPPTQPLEPVANTSLLALRGPSFTDDGPNRFAITRNGDTRITPFSPFKPHTIVPDSYSVYFDGSGDYIAANHSSSNSIAGDFTFECFARYPSDTPANGTIFGWRTGSSGWSGFILQRNSSSNLVLNVNIGGITITQTSATYTPDAWHHVAVTRSGSTVTLWVDGVSVGTATLSGTIGPGTGFTLGVDPFNIVSGTYFKGYISNARFVNGTAVYTSAFTPPTTPLTAITNTSLLTCQSPTIIDNSTNNFAITVNGNSQPTKFNPFGETVTTGVEYSPTTHGGSVYFDGTQDSVSLTPFNNSYFVDPFNTGKLTTIECWLYLNTLTSPRSCLFGHWTGSVGWTVDVDTNGNLFFAAGGAGTTVTLSTKIQINQWQHLALSFNGTTTTIYLNGTNVGSIGVQNPNDATTNFLIGCRSDNVAATKGYISNLVFYQGYTKYTSNFVPPQFIGYDSRAIIIINGTNAAIQDKTGRNVLETVGNARNVSESPYRLNKSVYFDGTGDYFSIPASSGFDLGTGDFTFELWLYIPSGGAGAGQLLTLQPASGTNFFQWFIGNSDGGTSWGINNVGNFSTSGAVPLNTWTHLALTRSGNTLRQFTNGVKTYENTNFTYTIGSATQAAFIGRDTGAYNNYLRAYLSNFRIIKGTALYTSAFTPPTTPLTAISGTSLLTCQSNRFVDNSTNNITITGNGDAKVTSFGPFTETNLTNNCMYFDADSDALRLQPGPLFVYGTGDFTVEGWFNHTVQPDQYGAILFAQTVSGTNYFMIQASRTSTERTIVFWFNLSGASTYLTSTNTYQLNTWNHFAVVRASGVVYIYLNGVQSGSAACTLNFNNITYQPSFGTYSHAFAQQFGGYIDDFRITKGVARYTSNFTPPIAAFKSK